MIRSASIIILSLKPVPWKLLPFPVSTSTSFIDPHDIGEALGVADAVGVTELVMEAVGVTDEVTLGVGVFDGVILGVAV